jgi:hypothetical protein
MDRKHSVLIHWSPEQVQAGLPKLLRTIDPVWRDRESDEGWSLICEFKSVPSDQGNPSAAVVSFLVDTAPKEWLRRGQLQLFERATGKHATVSVLD